MRNEFLIDPNLVFLNHGSFGACTREAFEAQQRWQLEMERNPVEFLSRRSAALLREARVELTRYLGAQVDDLVFINNATTGVNMVAQSLALQPGDEVLATDHEYGACDATWQVHCERQGAAYRKVEIPLPFAPEEFLPRVLAGVTPRTKVIFVSHITSVTALIFPIAELCRLARERGILTVIDGAHAPGQIDLDLDVIGADFYTGNCHKWMCAPKGAAFFHARPEHHEILQPPTISWGMLGNPGHDACTGSAPLERRMQWQGTRDIAGWLSVPVAIEFQAARDWPAVRARCHRMAVEAMHVMCERTGLPPAAPDVSFGQMTLLPVPSQDRHVLRERLYRESGIETMVTEHAGLTFVRLSVQGYTTPQDIAQLLAAPAMQFD